MAYFPSPSLVPKDCVELAYVWYLIVQLNIAQHYSVLKQWSATFFMTAQILSIKIIEGPAVHLKHTVAVAYAESFRDFVSDFATFSQNNSDL